MKLKLFWCLTFCTAVLLLDPPSGASDVTEVASREADAENIPVPSVQNVTTGAATRGNATAAAPGPAVDSDRDEDDDEDDYDDDDDDFEDAKDLSPSLADYIRSLMKGKSDADSSSTDASHASDSQGGHEAASSGERVNQTAPSQQETQGAFPDQTEGAISKVPSICAEPVDLQQYECGDDPWLSRYFRTGMTPEGIADMLFDMSVVHELQRKCPAGQWCLGDQLAALAFRAEQFYRGAFVWDEFWDCSLEVVKRRLTCDDRHLRFLLDAASLLVELIDWQSLPASQKQKARPCFAQTLAALHVTYAAFLDNQTLESSTCSGYSFHMTNTYLCTFSACNVTFLESVDALLEIKEFGWWEWIADHAEEVRGRCPGVGGECGAVDTLVMLLDDEAFNPGDASTGSYWDFDDLYDDDDEDYYDEDDYDYFDDEDYDEYYDDDYEYDYEDDEEYDYNDDDEDDRDGDVDKDEERENETNKGEASKSTLNKNSDERLKNNNFPAEGFFTSDDSSGLESDGAAEDRSLMTALAVATGVGALFMVAALLVFWHRRRRARSFFYYRDNYGKIYKDDAHLLGNSDE